MAFVNSFDWRSVSTTLDQNLCRAVDDLPRATTQDFRSSPDNTCNNCGYHFSIDSKCCPQCHSVDWVHIHKNEQEVDYGF